MIDYSDKSHYRRPWSRTRRVLTGWREELLRDPDRLVFWLMLAGLCVWLGATR